MRLTLVPPVVLLAAALLAPSAAQARPVHYYVSLGDSLSVGFQPDRPKHGTTTRQGYADYLFTLERRHFKRLRPVKLGCAGEDTKSISTDSVACAYGRYDNQLEAAEAFLRAHRKRISFVTIDIGANDVDSCAPGGVINFTCLNAGLARSKRNIPKIAKRLRKAGGKRMQILGMNYYDPFLGLYLKGGSSRSIALASVDLAKGFNRDIASAYRRRKIKVVDVARVFQTYDSATRMIVAPFGSIPVNVARICQWTWNCAAPPLGPNIHANAFGYSVIAQAFAKRIKH